MSRLAIQIASGLHNVYLHGMIRATARACPPPGLKLVNRLRGPSGSINAISWAPDGSVLAAASDDGTVQLWSGETGQPLRTMTGHSQKVTKIAWSHDGRMLASGSWDENIHI